MATNLTFIPQQTVVPSIWLNQVNAFVNTYGVCEGLDTTGATDMTLLLFSALSQCVTGQTLILPPGTITVDNLIIPEGIGLMGSGPGTILKRKSGSPHGSFITVEAGSTGFTLSNMTIDGNAANQTVAANNLNLIGVGSFVLDSLYVQNAYVGNGIEVNSTLDQANATRSVVRNCNVLNNQRVGIQIDTAWFCDCLNNMVNNNTLGGISYLHFSFPPVVQSQTFFKIQGNTCINSTGGSGISVNDFVTGGTSSAPVYGSSTPSSAYWIISGNVCCDNTGGYGIAGQGNNGIISGNLCANNGSSGAPFGAGIGLSGLAIVVSGNTVEGNYYYGIDGGGSSNCTVTGNVVTLNGFAQGNGVGINFGGGSANVISNNQISTNGGASGEVGINLQGMEGSGAQNGAFPFIGYACNITGNTISPNSTNSLGIWAHLGEEYVNVVGNLFLGGEGINQIGALACANLNVADNVWQDSGGGFALKTVQYAAALVIPDLLDNFAINGNGNITSINTSSSSTYAQGVRYVSMTTGGSGYKTTDTVVFTGGGGSGAAGLISTDGNGKVIGVNMTSIGTGYTSNPSVSFTTSTGSGAAGVGVIQCPNFNGRKITLMLLSGQTLVSGGNLSLNGNFSGPVSGFGVIVLMGVAGGWTEVSRGV